MNAKATASQQRSEPDWERVRIVIVDQDDEFRFWTKSIFRKRQICEVFTTVRPDDAFQYLCATEVHITLVALSSNSNKSIELLKKLRDTSSSPCPDIPIMVLVRKGEEMAASKAAAFGIEGIITKPISEDDFVAKVAKTVLKPRHGIRSLAVGAPDLPPPQPAVKPTPAPKVAAPPVPRKAPAPPKIAAPAIAKERPKPLEPRKKARESEEPEPEAETKEPTDQSLVDDLPPPKPKKQKTKHSPHDWAAELAEKKKKKVRRNTPAVNIDEVVKQHMLWLKTHGNQGTRAILEGADLSCCYLEGVNLSNANLQSADLSDANLSKANLNGADMRRAKLGGALLNDTNLGVAKLRHVDFSVCHLEDTNLRGADLSGANFSGANVNEADFTGAIFLDTDITDADLSHADGLSQRQIDRTRGNMNTKLPAGLQRKLVEVNK